MSLYNSNAQIKYDGPSDLKLFAEFLPFIGEVVISFSRLERRLIWGIESILSCTTLEADKLEATIQSYFARLQFFELVGSRVSRETNTEKLFQLICRSLLEANNFRNSLLHNSFTGISEASEQGVSKKYIMKHKYAEKAEKRPYQIEISELRLQTNKNFDLCNQIQAWILHVNPNAENRVP